MCRRYVNKITTKKGCVIEMGRLSENLHKSFGRRDLAILRKESIVAILNYFFIDVTGY